MIWVLIPPLLSYRGYDKDNICFINLKFSGHVGLALYFSGVDNASRRLSVSVDCVHELFWLPFLSCYSSLYNCDLLASLLRILLNQPLALSLFSSSTSTSVFHSPHLPPSLSNNIIREFFLSPHRRLHFLRTDATRSAPTPDWQVHERVQDCRAREVTSDRVQWGVLSFADICHHWWSSSLEGWWRDGKTSGGDVGEGVLVCGVACCVQVWS